MQVLEQQIGYPYGNCVNEKNDENYFYDGDYTIQVRTKKFLKYYLFINCL